MKKIFLIMLTVFLPVTNVFTQLELNEQGEIGIGGLTPVSGIDLYSSNARFNNLGINTSSPLSKLAVNSSGNSNYASYFYSNSYSSQRAGYYYIDNIGGSWSIALSATVDPSIGSSSRIVGGNGCTMINLIMEKRTVFGQWRVWEHRATIMEYMDPSMMTIMERELSVL